MHAIMSERRLQLALEVGQALPVHTCWRVNDGYVRATGWSHRADVYTLGIWGPGDIVIPGLLSQKPMELRALSGANVHECSPQSDEVHRFSRTQIQQMAVLLELTRIRPAEARLFHLLIWLSDRFGSHTEQGRSIPLEAMNLTHRQLAEMASVSRVTVTKALGHFRQQGWLQRLGEEEVLFAAALSLFQSLR
jgi:hypothetical protein